MAQALKKELLSPSSTTVKDTRVSASAASFRGSLLPYLRANANILLESNQGVCGELDVSLERALARCQPARKTARLPTWPPLFKYTVKNSAPHPARVQGALMRGAVLRSFGLDVRSTSRRKRRRRRGI